MSRPKGSKNKPKESPNPVAGTPIVNVPIPYWTPAKPVESEGRIYSILGIVFAVLSLVVLPIVFGPIAVILGIIGYLKGDRNLGMTAIVLGVVLSVLSTLIATWIILNWW